MQKLEADYLVIGSGAVSMTFVDTMLDERPDATFIMVDRHHLPGGHWNDAYPFVRLHQPSAFYGVASTALGSNRIDREGSNKGYYELASGAEVLSYFDRVMRERLLASGRVQYFPMHDYLGEHRFTSLLSDDTYSVTVKKSVVDGTFFKTNVPSLHKRKFDVEDGVSCIPPNRLPSLASQFSRYTILGGGKTAMDTGVWLLDHGVDPDAIRWVCPRGSWLMHRNTTQPGAAFFKNSVGGVANQFEVMATATSVDSLFLGLEAAGVMLRIDKDNMPSMFHYATISEGEVAQLASIKDVVRGQRVSRVSANEIELGDGTRKSAEAGTLYIDCTASAVVFEAGSETRPVFEDGLITLQAVYAPLVTYSAAIIARIEAQFSEIGQKNAMSTPIQFCDTPAEWMAASAQNMMNQNIWSQSPEMKKWINACRLNPTSLSIHEGALSDPENAAILARISKAAVPAVMNMHKLMSELG